MILSPEQAREVLKREKLNETKLSALDRLRAAGYPVTLNESEDTRRARLKDAWLTLKARLLPAKEKCGI